MVIRCKRARAWADVPTEGEHTGPPTIDRELAVQVEQDGVASSPWWNSGGCGGVYGPRDTWGLVPLFLDMSTIRTVVKVDLETFSLKTEASMVST